MNRDRLINVFLELVRIDSPSGLEEGVAKYLKKIFTKLGLKPFRDSFGNLIVRIKGSGDPLLLSAHMDTVEPGKNVKPKIINGIIKSNGKTILGADNKAAIAAIAEVVRNIIENKIKSKPLDIIFTRTEELSDTGASHIDPKKISSKKGYVFDNENPIGTIITSSPFYYGFDIKIIGKGAHASMPEKGVNSLEIFSEALKGIRLGKISDMTIANIGMINGGNARNSIPAEIFLQGEVRSYVQNEAMDNVNLIINKFKTLTKKFGGKLESSYLCDNPGYIHKQDDNFISKTKNVMRELNIKPVLKKSWGCSDANVFIDKGIRVLNLGNGAKYTHTTKESISVNSLVGLSDLILALISKQ